MTQTRFYKKSSIYKGTPCASASVHWHKSVQGAHFNNCQLSVVQSASHKLFSPTKIFNYHFHHWVGNLAPRLPFQYPLKISFLFYFIWFCTEPHLALEPQVEGHCKGRAIQSFEAPSHRSSRRSAERTPPPLLWLPRCLQPWPVFSAMLESLSPTKPKLKLLGQEACLL